MLTQAEVEYKQNCSKFVYAKKLYTRMDVLGRTRFQLFRKNSVSISAKGMILYIS